MKKLVESKKKNHFFFPSSNAAAALSTAFEPLSFVALSRLAPALSAPGLALDEVPLASLSTLPPACDDDASDEQEGARSGAEEEDDSKDESEGDDKDEDGIDGGGCFFSGRGRRPPRLHESSAGGYVGFSPVTRHRRNGQANGNPEGIDEQATALFDFGIDAVVDLPSSTPTTTTPPPLPPPTPASPRRRPPLRL